MLLTALGIAASVTHWTGAETPGVGGQLLVASTDMADPRFAGTVIYMVQHDADGALGIIVNRPIAVVSLSDLAADLGLDPPEVDRDIRLHYGGPVSTGAVMVLHGPDYREPGTIGQGPIAALTRSDTMFAALRQGGSADALVAAGYSGWSPNQLDNELSRGDWHVVAADRDLVFGESPDTTWSRAMEKRGLDL